MPIFQLAIILLLLLRKTSSTYPAARCSSPDVVCICTVNPACLGDVNTLLMFGSIDLPPHTTLYLGEGPHDIYHDISYSEINQTIVPFPGEEVELRFHVESVDIAGALVTMFQKDNSVLGSESNGGKLIISYEGGAGGESVDAGLYIFQSLDVEIHNIEIRNTGPCCESFAPDTQQSCGIHVRGPLFTHVLVSNVKITNVRHGVFLDAIPCFAADPTLITFHNIVVEDYCGKGFNMGASACFVIDGGWMTSTPATAACNVPDPALQTAFYVDDAHRFWIQNVFVERHVNHAYDGGVFHVNWGESDRGTDKVLQNNFFQCEGFAGEKVIFFADDSLDGEVGIFKLVNNVFSGCSDAVVEILIDGTQSLIDIPSLFSGNYVGFNYELQNEQNWDDANNYAHPAAAIVGGSETKPYPFYKLQNVDVCSPGGIWLEGDSPASDYLGNPRVGGGRICVGPVQEPISSALRCVIAVSVLSGILGLLL